MKSWPVQDAKSRFSEFLKASLTEGRKLSRCAAPRQQYSRRCRNGAVCMHGRGQL
ncbi:MAG: hypothetical protein JWO52_6315 [Gammaproteobacteria bacterium]|jgi:hypothetical protein|nr:hypothetical protein [Gammaproteobacteria bacterium]